MTGKDIKVIRNKLLLLQDELAHELGVSITTVRMWETGKMGMSIKRQREVLEFCKKKGVKI
jgi:DNA-binding transcriptional regulator YiaG